MLRMLENTNAFIDQRAEKDPAMLAPGLFRMLRLFVADLGQHRREGVGMLSTI
jgi:hypothetical protein